MGEEGAHLGLRAAVAASAAGEDLGDGGALQAAQPLALQDARRHLLRRVAPHVGNGRVVLACTPRNHRHHHASGRPLCQCLIPMHTGQ